MIKIVKKVKCRYSHLSHKWKNGDEDRYCTNDICELCTLPITDDDCMECEFYIKDENVKNNNSK